MARKIVIIVVILFGVSTIAYLGASTVLYNRFAGITPKCNGAFQHTPADFTAAPFAPDMDTSPYWMPEYENVNITSLHKNLNLSGWYIPGENQSAIIIVHGLGASAPECKRNPRVLIPAGMLHRNSFDVLLIDLSEYGDSDIEDGKWAAGTKEYKDVLAAWHWLQTEKGFTPEQIGILAYSGGTSSALVAMGAEPRIAALWMDSPYIDLYKNVEDTLDKSGYPRFLAPGGFLMARLLSGDDFSTNTPMSAIENLRNRPIFITHCETDTIVSVDYALKFADDIDLSENNLWITSDCDHVRSQFLYPDEYEQRLVNFFNQHLSG